MPKLVSLSINPAVVDGSAPAPTVTITGRLTDPMAGMPLTSDDRAPGGMAIVTSPSGADHWARFDYSTVSRSRERRSDDITS